VGTGKILTRVEIAAIAWGVNIASGIMNTIGTKGIGRMSSFNVWWTLGGTFVLVRVEVIFRHEFNSLSPGYHTTCQGPGQGSCIRLDLCISFLTSFHIEHCVVRLY
jgi:hypothetical protein